MTLILDSTFSEIEKDYYRHEMPKVRKSIAELIAEIGTWGKEQRVLCLERQFNATQGEINRIYAHYESLTKADTPYLDKYIGTIRLEGLKKEFKKIKSEMNYLKNAISGKSNGNGITPEMIERARDFPISELIELKRGMARCPFHPDKTPSFSVKNNRFRCFGCGTKGDSIQFVMNQDNLSFIEAVKSLN